MPYRRTDNVQRKLAARRDAILKAARALASGGGMAAVQIAPVADHAGIAAGTVYRYFPAKADLVTELVETLAQAELAALGRAAEAAPGPLSALVAAIATFGTRGLADRRLAFAVIAEPVEGAAEAARLRYRAALAEAFAVRIRAAIAAGYLPDQDVVAAASALVGALIEGLVGPFAPEAGDDPARRRAVVQAATLFALRGLGVVDARARGLVVQARIGPPG